MGFTGILFDKYFLSILFHLKKKENVNENIPILLAKH